MAPLSSTVIPAKEVSRPGSHFGNPLSRLAMLGGVKIDTFVVAFAVARSAKTTTARKGSVARAIFVLDDVLPMSFVPPHSWGTVRTRWIYLYKGLPVESLTFENDNTIKRATARVHGHD
jgi:hypothetical protein